jgi:microcystin degradation protein MlrC
MRLFAAALGLEANTFAPVPTSYRAFAEKLYFPPGHRTSLATRPPRCGWRAGGPRPRATR